MEKEREGGREGGREGRGKQKLGNSIGASLTPDVRDKVEREKNWGTVSVPASPQTSGIK